MTGKERKGTFSRLGLPVSESYVVPRSRNRVLLLGILLGLLLLAVGLVDLLVADGRRLSGGPLSAAHANLDDDCGSCHEPLSSASNENCSLCHEKFGDRLGVYTFDAHYLYRSGDFQRLVPSPNEVPCAECHGEHQGRTADLTRVDNSLCLPCHRQSSFGRRHPEFDAVERGMEDARLRFPHIHHVREVMREQQLVDVERACLYCHRPDAEGRGFEPLSFDGQCDACHLPPTLATPLLPLDRPGVLGVESLEEIRRQGRPGSGWAARTSPSDFRESSGEIRKSPVRHQDPWILHNLRRLRQLRYPDAGLVDLLRASSGVEPREQIVLYEEALGTLRGYVDELRSSSDRRVQRELRRIERLIEAVERRLEDPYVPLDETKFVLALPSDGESGTADREAVEELAAALTEPCRQCHLISDLTVVRVQKDQSTLHRAEFDHRAHIIQRRCLECHTEIPFLERLAGEEKVEASVDRAEIVNLPGIETCRQCHEPDLAGDSCTTCHDFHPDQSRRSDLLLYLEP